MAFSVLAFSLAWCAVYVALHCVASSLSFVRSRMRGGGVRPPHPNPHHHINRTSSGAADTIATNNNSCRVTRGAFEFAAFGLSTASTPLGVFLFSTICLSA